MLRLLLSLLSFTALTAAQDLATKIDEYIQAHMKAGRFSGSVLIERDGELLHKKGYLLADREHGAPNTPRTPFRIGSITKQFTAAGILKLVEAGKLSLVDSPAKFVDNSHPDWKKVTIRHLLNHTSGIPSFTGFPEYRNFKLKRQTPQEVVAFFKDKPLDFEPGSQFRYNNSGYYLLGYIIEQVSGQSYSAYLQEHLLKPLGLRDTGVDENRMILPGRAEGYTYDAEGNWRNADYIDMTVPGGAGSLYSTVEDLLRWNTALQAGKVVGGKLWEEMKTPGKGNYGFGLLIGPVRGHKAIHHGGGIEGFNTELAWLPESRITIVALSNVNTPVMAQITGDLAAIALGEPYQLTKQHTAISLATAVLDRYTGRYQLGPNFILTITREGEHLMSQATGQSKLEIFPESETEFFLKVVDASITFVKNEQGQVDRLILHQGGRDITAKRISE